MKLNNIKLIKEYIENKIEEIPAGKNLTNYNRGRIAALEDVLTLLQEEV